MPNKSVIPMYDVDMGLTTVEMPLRQTEVVRSRPEMATAGFPIQIQSVETLLSFKNE